MLAPTRLLLFAVTASAWLDARSIQKWLGTLGIVGENSNAPVSQLHEDLTSNVPATSIEIYPCNAASFATSSSVDKVPYRSKRADVRAISPGSTKGVSSGCLDYLSASVATLSSAASRYTGGSAGFIQFENAENAVENQIAKCSNELSNSVTSADSAARMNTFAQKFIPILKAALDALLSKSSQFKSSGFGSLIRDDLSSLSSGSNQIATILIAKAPPANKATASSFHSTVIRLFSSAFSAFDGARKRDELRVEAAHAPQPPPFPTSATSVPPLIAALSAGSTACTKYTGGMIGVLPINSAMGVVQSQIKKATSELRSSPVLAPAQVDNAIGVLGKSFPLLKNLLNCLVGKKSSLRSAGLSGTVNGQLTSLRSAMNAYCTAIIAKAPAAKKSPASSASSVVVSIFNSAISAFNSFEKRDPEPDTIPELLPRAYADVTNDISALSTSVISGRSVCGKYTGGLGGAIPVNSAINAIQSQISKTTTDVNSTPAATVAQASAIIDYFRTKLIPTIKLLLDCLVTKKAQFKSAGLGPTVQSDLGSLSSGSNALATALIAKAPAASKAAVSDISKTVISLFNSAISAFNAAKRDEEPMAAPALVPRAYADVTQGLYSLSAVLSRGSGACHTSGIAPINSAMNNVQSQISKLNTDVNSILVMTSAQANFIITYFNNPILPLFKAFLNCVVSRRAQFKASGLGPTFNGDLANLRSGSNALATALIAKAPAANKAAASDVSRTIISIFNSAISAFNAKRDPGPEAAPNLLQPRGVTNDLSALSTSLATLSSTYVKYTGGLVGVIAINSAENAFHSQISKAITDFRNTPAFTNAQASVVCGNVLNKLVPIWRACKNALVAKKAQFQSSGFGSHVQDESSRMSSDAKALATAIIAKAPAISKDLCSNASKSLVGIFTFPFPTFPPADKRSESGFEQALAGPILVPRTNQPPVPTPASTANELSKLNSYLSTATKACNVYVGGPAALAPILSADDAVRGQIVKINSDTVSSSSAQVDYTCNILVRTSFPLLKAYIYCLVSKKNIFVSEGYQSVIGERIEDQDEGFKGFLAGKIGGSGEDAQSTGKGCAQVASKSVGDLFEYAKGAFA